MRILLTNDDGIHAPGLFALAQVAREFGDVRVVAPDRERSACAHAMTLRDPLRIHELDYHGLPGYQVNGFPVDCVNVALTVAFPDGCDLVISGINNGPNLGYDITYSGTVGGAMEGCINGIPSIAVSMATFVDGAPDHFETGARWLSENFHILSSFSKDRTFLNINVPAIAFEELQGSRIAGMGRRVYQDRVEERSDPWGRRYFWQGGVAVMRSDDPETDVYAVSHGFVSITPVSLDWTDRQCAEELKSKLRSLV